MALKDENTYDVIVVGAGHAGCEAALASARMGAHTLLLNLYLDNTALMPCNPCLLYTSGVIIFRIRSGRP